MKRAFAMVLAAACAASAEDKSVLHIYDVNAVTSRVSSFRAQEVGFSALGVGRGSEMGPAIGVGVEEEGLQIAGDDLKLLVSQNIAPGTWDTPPHSIEFQNGALYVVHTQAVQDQVRAFLDVVRSRACRTIVVEAEVLELAPGGPDAAAGTLLSDEQIKAFDDAVADDARGRRAASLRACGVNGQRFNAQAIGEETYVRDFDLEIAKAQAIADPVVDMARTGASIDVLPLVSPDGSVVFLTARFHAADAAGFRAFQPGGPTLGTIDEPDQVASSTETTLAIPAGRTAVLSAVAWPGAGDGWTQVVLVRPTVSADQPLPWPDTGKPVQLRIFDARAVLAPAPAFPGPRLGGIPAASQGAPTTGVAFTTEEAESGVLVNAEQLVSLLKHDVDPESWDARASEVSIALTGDRQLLVVHSPAVLKQVEEALARLMRSRSRVVSVDAWVFALDGAAWQERRASVSGTIADDAWKDLMAAAAKGTGVRIAASARAAGLNGSRFHAARGLVRTVVLDDDVQIAEAASALDPVVSAVAEGISLDVTPASVADSGQVQLDLRPTVVLGGAPTTFTMKEKGGVVQAISLSEFGVRTQMLVDAGKPALAGVATREEGGKTEVLLLVVRAGVTDVK